MMNRRRCRALMAVFDTRPFFFAFFPVTVGVYDQQGKENRPRRQHHDKNGLPAPDFGHEVGEIGRHLCLIYTASGESQIAG